MTVYVVQKQVTWDDVAQTYVPRFDVEPAEKFGDIQYVFGPSSTPYFLEEVRESLSRNMSDFREGDYIVPCGNPVLLGMAFAYAADKTDGVLNVLQWEKGREDYAVVTIDNLFDMEEGYDAA